jgi:putative addiction module component (TIGR02574 family)
VNAQTSTLIEAVLALPESERLLVAERLLETLPPELADLSDEEFAQELQRRRTEVIEGKEETVSWSILKEQR